MATLSSRAELTHGPPIMASAKPQGGIMHTARGTSEPRRISGEEPKGAGSSKHGDNNEQAGRQQGDEKDSSGRGGDEGGGGAAQAPPALQTSDVTLRAKEGRIFACPFRKRNPLRFNIREHGECSYVGFSMADLKYVGLTSTPTPTPTFTTWKGAFSPNLRANTESISQPSMPRHLSQKTANAPQRPKSGDV